MRFSNLITLLEANLYNKNDFLTAIDKLLKSKNVTKPEIINWFKKQYVNWYTSSTNDDERADNRRHKMVMRHMPAPNDPEWAKKPGIMKFIGFNTHHIDFLKHVIDYFEQLDDTELKKIYKQPYEIIINKVKEWDEYLASQMGKEQEKLEEGKDVQTLMTFPDGYRFVKLLSKKAYDVEGKQMGHCAASYSDRTDSILYSLKDKKNESHATIQYLLKQEEPEDGVYNVDRDDNLTRKGITQIKGKENAAPIKKYWPYIRKFIESNKFIVLADGDNIGYVEYDDIWFDPDEEKFKKYYNEVIVPNRNDFINTIFEEAKYNNGEVRNIFLHYYFLEELPDFSNIIVTGNFICNGNQLTSLKGSPKEVRGIFNCKNNQLTSLLGAPKKVGSFHCEENQLTSLEGAPKEVEDSFFCYNNKLTSLQGSPYEVKSFFCDDNQLRSLKGAPKIVRNHFSCKDNELTSLIGSPKEVGAGFFCDHNQLVSLHGISEKIGRFFSVGNPVKFTEEDVKKAMEKSRIKNRETFKEYFDRRGTIV
jgi:hypothetical protein